MFITFHQNKVMDSKVTLSLNEAVIKKAKKYADSHNISLSRLVEFLLARVTTANHASLEDLSYCRLGSSGS